MPLQLPLEFCERIKARFGVEYQNFINSLNNPSPTSIRFNPAKSIENIPDTIDINTQIPWSSTGVYLQKRPQFIFDPYFHAGCYYVQEASSMFLHHALAQIIDPQKDIKVLDLCAAPGGKSTLINSIISQNSVLVANEVIKNRSEILRENLTKWGNSNFVITSNNPQDFGKLENFFDIIVIDAPCSGEGMFRKDPESIAHWNMSNVNHCAFRQKNIITDVIKSLKDGGHLVYSTCTYSPEENEYNCDWMIENFELNSIKIAVDPSWGIVENSVALYSYHFYPHKTKGEGLFMSCFQKFDLSNEKLEKQKSYIPKSSKFEFINNINLQELGKWLEKPDAFEFMIYKDEIYALQKSILEALKVINCNLNIQNAGLLMGKMMGQQLIPSHELALNIAINKDLNSVEFSLQQALIYLKKEDVSSFDCLIDKPLGWILVKYNSHNIGWIKKINNRCNNYFPKELRIIKDLKGLK